MLQPKYPIRKGSLPVPGKALTAAVLPEYFLRNDVLVAGSHGQPVKTAHLSADGRKFNWRVVYDNDQVCDSLYITQFSYTGTEGEVLLVDVEPRNPHPVNHGPGITEFAYVTKINNLRWGVNVLFNYQTGDTQIIADQGSPIIGVLMQLI